MAIDINIPSQVAQTITNGVTGTAPSQDAVFDALALKENAINKGLANGYAPLNASTKIDSTYLPPYIMKFVDLPPVHYLNKDFPMIDVSIFHIAQNNYMPGSSYRFNVCYCPRCCCTKI